MTLPVTDAFTGIDGTLLENHAFQWTKMVGSIAIKTNGLQPNFGSGNLYSVYRWNADIFPNDQYAKLTCSLVSNTQIGCTVRTSSFNANCYVLMFDSSATGQITLNKFIGGVLTLLTTDFASFAANDIMELDVIGNTLSSKKNGAADIGNTTDTSLSSGSAGLFSWNSEPNKIADNWEAGSLAVVLIDRTYKFRRRRKHNKAREDFQLKSWF